MNNKKENIMVDDKSIVIKCSNIEDVLRRDTNNPIAEEEIISRIKKANQENKDVYIEDPNTGERSLLPKYAIKKLK